MNQLYHDEIMTLARGGYGDGRINGADVYQARATNPLCGDECTVYVKRSTPHAARYHIDDFKHETRGCALCLAAAARLAQAAENAEHIGELHALHRGFLAMLKNGKPPPPSLRLFTPVVARKSRHACVLLPFDALMRAIQAATAAPDRQAQKESR